MNLANATIGELQCELDQGRESARSLVEGYLARIRAFDAQGVSLNAVTRLSAHALDEADVLDKERRSGSARGPLHGVPFLVKDNTDVAGMPTTAGSAVLEDMVADHDATIVARLRAAGAVVIGKTNLHEFAAGITTVGSAAGRTRNPFDPTRNPGGSSGGTGAAVAAGLAAFGTGTDTCGSIRVPAAQNSLYGLRPTQGLTSLAGIVPLCLRQDVAGPIARSAVDLAITLDAIAGPDERDPNTAVAEGRTPSFISALEGVRVEGMRIGRLDTLFGAELEDAEVATLALDTMERLASLGAEIVPVEIPDLPELLDVNFTVILAELPEDLRGFLAGRSNAPFANLPDILATGQVHEEVAPILQAAVDVDFKATPEYARALENRGRIQTLLLDALERHQVAALAYPTLQRVAAPLGSPQEGSNAYASADSGLPALTIPWGCDATGHPIGLDLLGEAFEDAQLVATAAAIERALPLRSVPTSTPNLDRA